LLKFHPEKTDSVDQAIKVTDRLNREFIIQAKFDTKKAGVRIVFYAKNCLICHTDERLNFYTMRRPDLFAADNSNQFPEAVVDVRGPRSKEND
jgi:hypothetical protein